MIDFENIPNVYFLGIGGIGMSSLARFAKASGKNVAGYDLVETELTKQLVSEGIPVHFTDNTEFIPHDFSPQNTLVVLTPAVPKTLGEYQHLHANKYPLVKRSELLGLLTQNRFCIAVAGTHGKTSVSTMIAYLLHECGLDTGAFMGGISRNFNSNLLLPENGQSMVVTEADEFDRSFLQLNPSIALVTSLDPDHLDVYGDFSSLKEAFGQFICNTVTDGKVLFNKSVNLSQFLPCTVNAYYYSLNDENADYYAKNIRIIDNKFLFDFYAPHMVIHDIRMGYPGRVNLENMVAAMAVSMMVGADPEEIRKAVISYKGVVRRFDVRYANNETVYIDDYAHHPRELEATINSVRELYPGKKITGIFQPHLYSRTRDFATGFAQSLDLLDETILLDIYPAREGPIAGVSSKIIYDKMKNKNKIMCSMDNLPGVLKSKNFEILLTLGAGNIDKMVEPIEKILNNKYAKK